MIDDLSYNQPAEIDQFFLLNIFHSIMPIRDEKVVVKSFKNSNDCYKIIFYRANNSTIYTYFDNNLKLHRDDGPAITLVINTIIRREEYFKHGIAHRIGEPQEIHYSSKGKIGSKDYRINGIHHRDNGPAITFYSDIDYSKLFQEVYIINGKYHRENGPAYLHYNKLGNIKVAKWYKNDCCHRLDGPAVIEYFSNTIETLEKEEQWYVNDKLINSFEYPIIKNNKVCGKVPLTKDSILNAMLFDRDYGTFLKDFYNKTSK